MKVFNEIKKNKYTSIAVLAFIFFLILMFIVYKAVMPSLGIPVYGNRLDGIEEVEITVDKMSSLDEKIGKESYIVSSKTNLSGKTLNTMVVVKDGTKSATAKKVTDVVLGEFSKEQIKYFDFQVFIESENKEQSNYPIIAYKNKSNEKFSYSSAK